MRALPAIVAMLLSGNLAASDIFDYKGQLSGEYFGVKSASGAINFSRLRYIPDLLLKKNFSDDNAWDMDISANAYAAYQSNSSEHYDTSAKWYRFNTRYQTGQSELQLGLQQVNFGPAVILRSLRWFDQVSPTDPLKLTQGVKAVRYRYFFMDNANLWFWGLYGNEDAKGYERVASKSHTPELGARYQFPQASGELGLSTHVRKTQAMGFTGDDLGYDLIEKRFAVDGKWDLGAGIWFEYVLLNQGANTMNHNWVSMLTLGTDYTFAYGNGVSALFEHLISSVSNTASSWDQEIQSSALQVSYPLNLLDAVSFLTFYSWQQQNLFHYARWNRTYDNWSFSLSVFLSSAQVPSTAALVPAAMLGDGVQAMIIYNH